MIATHSAGRRDASRPRNPATAFGLALAAGLALAGAGQAHAQTINWGTPMFSDIVDSQGFVVGNTYKFELGTFSNNFVPDSNNVANWITYWKVFDVGNYNGIEDPDDGISGYVTSVAQMNPDGSSAETPDFDFQNLDAYLWVRNWDAPVPGAEWLLVRDQSWVFPIADPDNCNCSELPIEWSVSDLDQTNVPLWGGQGGVNGPGEHTDQGTHTLQTFTFIPEPSAMILLGVGAAAGLLRRRR